MENDVVRSSKTIFYCRFVDDIYNRLKVGDNVLFDQLNSYYPNIYLTLEVNPRHKLANIHGTYKFNSYGKNAKLPSTWISKTPKRYKRNTINGDHHCSKRISSNFFLQSFSIKVNDNAFAVGHFF